MRQDWDQTYINPSMCLSLAELEELEKFRIIWDPRAESRSNETNAYTGFVLTEVISTLPIVISYGPILIKGGLGRDYSCLAVNGG